MGQFLKCLPTVETRIIGGKLKDRLIRFSPSNTPHAVYTLTLLMFLSVMGQETTYSVFPIWIVLNRRIGLYQFSLYIGETVDGVAVWHVNQ